MVARSLHEEGLAAGRRTGDRTPITMHLTGLATLALLEQDYRSAGQLAEECHRLAREIGEKWFVAHSLRNLGYVARYESDVGQAAARFRESLALNREIGAKHGILQALIGLAGLTTGEVGRSEDAEQAVRLLAAAEALNATLKTSMMVLDRVEHDRQTTALRAALGEEAFAAAWEAGQALTLEEAVAEAEQVSAPGPTDARTQTAIHAPSAAAFPAGLTEREVEVLRLVAQGLTSARVAEQLVISPVTVSTHLRNIYGKLGVNSRGAAIRFAVERGLV
jgi:DNA-binding CsgD family transcriptional regulator